jgi:hypothetical protein
MTGSIDRARILSQGSLYVIPGAPTDSADFSPGVLVLSLKSSTPPLLPYHIVLLAASKTGPLEASGPSNVKSHHTSTTQLVTEFINSKIQQ